MESFILPSWRLAMRPRWTLRKDFPRLVRYSRFYFERVLVMPSWMAPFADLSPRHFGKLITALAARQTISFAAVQVRPSAWARPSTEPGVWGCNIVPRWLSGTFMPTPPDRGPRRFSGPAHELM